MKTRVHVNQHNIRANQKGASAPVLSAKTYKGNRKGNRAEVVDPVTGEVLGVFVYRPNKPLACGARVWFETDKEVRVCA